MSSNAAGICSLLSNINLCNFKSGFFLSDDPTTSVKSFKMATFREGWSSHFLGILVVFCDSCRVGLSCHPWEKGESRENQEGFPKHYM